MLTDKIDLDFFEIRWLWFVLGGSLGKGMVGSVGSLDGIQVLVRIHLVIRCKGIKEIRMCRLGAGVKQS